MEKYIDVCHGSLLAVVCVLHLTTPEKHVIGKILGVNQDHQREGEQQPLIMSFPCGRSMKSWATPQIAAMATIIRRANWKTERKKRLTITDPLPLAKE
jgi:hypothetical protein